MLKIEPLKSVGDLKYFMREEEVHRILGQPNRVEESSFERKFEFYGSEIESVTYQKEYGLVGVAIENVPVIINGVEVLSVRPEVLKNHLDSNHIKYEEDIDKYTGELESIYIHDWCALVNYDDDIPCYLEIGVAKWNEGKIVEIKNV